MRDNLVLGLDFEPVSKSMWQMLVANFTTPTNEPDREPALPLVRSFEKLGLGIRTQLEYFYQQVRLLSNNCSSSAPSLA